MCPIWLPLLSFFSLYVIAKHRSYLSSIQCRGSNSQPLDQELSALTTRPLLLTFEPLCLSRSRYMKNQFISWLRLRTNLDIWKIWINLDLVGDFWVWTLMSRQDRDILMDEINFRKVSRCPQLVNDWNLKFGRYRNFGNFDIGQKATDTDTERGFIPKPIPIPKPIISFHYTQLSRLTLWQCREQDSRWRPRRDKSRSQGLAYTL